MADVKITALAVLTAADPINDAIPIVDVSDVTMAASGTTKRISVNNILSSSPTATGAFSVTGLVTAGSATITGAATVGTTLGVTGVSTFAAGTALLPALTTTGDVNTGIYYPAADTFAVTTGGTERYRVDSSGNLLVGTVSPSSLIGGSGAITAKGLAGTLSVNVTALATDNTLPIGAFSGILTIRSNGGGGSAVFMLDPNAGAVSIANNIVGRTITLTFSGGSWKMQQTVGVVPSIYNYLVLATQ
jgi:hypothetical protein